MFWRFGFNKASTIDSLLDKEDVSLEAILDEDDLLQECKSQNTRLIDYFQRVDVLQKLLAYVTGQIEGEDRGRFRYPYIATEVLCSEIWSIVETCLNEQAQLMIPFWETVLERSPEDMKTQMVMASHFAKINAVFITKKPAEMLAFIRSQPSVVERLLRHVETPSFVDLIVRIIQLDELPGGAGVLEWLSAENFMGRLTDLLSPAHTNDIHAVVADLIKGIISMAAPSPGTGLTEGLQNGPASNQFARELARPRSIAKLVTYMLNDFGPDDNVVDERTPTEKQDLPNGDQSEVDSGSASAQLPNFDSCVSSVVHSICIIVELIRKNNSDYFEPYLFHTLRNRLIVVQQHQRGDSEDGRAELENAMKEMVDRMGVVHLGPVLEIMCQKLGELQALLRKPRSLRGTISTSIGEIVPLTFERYRLCELFAELLHCSNMSLLNRDPKHDHLYDSEGCLQGGLAGLEELSQIIHHNTGGRESEAMDEAQDEIEPARELPISGTPHDLPSIDSDEDMSDNEPGSSDDDAMEEIAMYDESPKPSETPLPQPHMVVPSSPNAASLPSPLEIATQGAALSRTGSFGPSSDPDIASVSRPHSSRRSSRRMIMVDSAPLPIGEQLKKKFIEVEVLPTLLDLFFEFPWNNFLHGAVYDIIHQVLTGPVEGGYSRELAVSLFRDARLMHRIVEGQKRNDALFVSNPKAIRLGYMGHLTLLAEDIIISLERFPPELRLVMIQYAPDPEWDEYVTGRYHETKKRDTRLLGGGKPMIMHGGMGPRSVANWKVDEDMPDSGVGGGGGGIGKQQQMKGEFRRVTGGSGGVGGGGGEGAGAGAGMSGLTSLSISSGVRGGADFGSAMDEDDEEDDEDEDSAPPHFARYLAQEMHSSDNFGSSESDDEDEEGGWLSHSVISLSAPPVSARHQSTERRPLSSTGFDDAFNPGDAATRAMAEDPFNSSDDDGFGPFSDSASGSGSDPFTFPSSFSDEMEDTSFESFGEFGEFQAAAGGNNGFGMGGAGDGDLTPTTGSWTFASDVSGSSDDGDGERLEAVGGRRPKSTEKDKEKEKEKEKEKK